MTPNIERKLEEIAAEQSYTPGSEHMHAMRLGCGVSAEQIEALQARVAELEKVRDDMEKERNKWREIADRWLRLSNDQTLICSRLREDRDGLAAKCAELIHYPDCWDTVAYPALQDALNNIDADYQGCTECAEKALAKLKADAVREFADQTGDHYVINMAIDYNKANQSQEQAHD